MAASAASALSKVTNPVFFSTSMLTLMILQPGGGTKAPLKLGIVESI